MAVTGPTSPYAGLGASATASYWLLGGFAVVLAAGAYAAARHRAGRG